MATGVIPALWNSSKITLRVLWRAARQFFHEAMGALFAIFALYGAVAAWRQWHSKVAAWLLGFALVYAVLMAFFAVTSFRRARRVR
ncbi:MAG: hypothetical protein ABSF40_00265 [Candidatus Acidiferrales bacterium]|jgi:hypothetical protein